MTEAEDLTETERKLTDLSAAIQKSLLDTSEEGLEQVLRLSAEFRKVSDEFIRSHPITPELQPRVRNCFFLIREQVRIVLDACTNARDKTGQELAKLRSGGKAKSSTAASGISDRKYVSHHSKPHGSFSGPGGFSFASNHGTAGLSTDLFFYLQNWRAGITAFLPYYIHQGGAADTGRFSAVSCEHSCF